MRLFVFESHPVQYHAPVYRRVHELCAAEGRHSIRVHYGTEAIGFDPGFRRAVQWDEPLLEGYDCTVLGSGRGIFGLLRGERPDAVLINQLAHAFDWTTLLGAAVLGIPVWMRCEVQDEAHRRSALKSLVRGAIYRLVYRLADHWFAIGSLNLRHYLRHGVSRSAISFARYCVPDRFASLSDEDKAAARRKVREEAGFAPETQVLLFSGKLQPKKQPDLLLRALAAMPARERAGFGVLYLGSGELEEQLRELAGSIPEVRVHFAGFKNQTEIADYYLAADTLVLPSRQMGETWGLVVNEALLAGKQVIVSRHVGSYADFRKLPAVRVFDGGIEEFLRVLRETPPSEAPRDFLERYSVDAAAAGIFSHMRNGLS